MSRRTSADSASSNAALTAPFLLSSTATAAATSSNTLPIASARACLACVRNASRSFGAESSRTRANSARSLPALGSNAHLGFAACATRSFWIFTRRLHSAWPNAIASSIVSSDTSFAPDSTMRIASSVPAMTSSSADAFFCAVVGFAMNFPSTWATRTAPTGPSNGMPDRHSAADVPFMARMSGSFCPSPERTRQITWTSFLKPSGKSGRIGRSISRQVSVSFLTGAPSRLKYPPGMRPPAYAFSRYSTVSGKKSCDSLADFAATHVASTMLPP